MLTGRASVPTFLDFSRVSALAAAKAYMAASPPGPGRPVPVLSLPVVASCALGGRSGLGGPALARFPFPFGPFAPLSVAAGVTTGDGGGGGRGGATGPGSGSALRTLASPNPECRHFVGSMPVMRLAIAFQSLGKSFGWLNEHVAPWRHPADIVM